MIFSTSLAGYAAAFKAAQTPAVDVIEPLNCSSATREDVVSHGWEGSAHDKASSIQEVALKLRKHRPGSKTGKLVDLAAAEMCILEPAYVREFAQRCREVETLISKGGLSARIGHAFLIQHRGI